MTQDELKALVGQAALNYVVPGQVVGVVAEAFDMTLNGVSKHVKVLEGAGVVRRRVEGRVHWISVDWSALQVAYEFLHAHHHFWSTRLDALVDYAQIQSRPKKGNSK